MDEQRCPRCGGDGEALTISASPKAVKCELCRGKGSVPPGRYDRWLQGRAMRDSRIRRGLSLSEEASRLNMTPIELGRLERGVLNDEKEG